MNKSRKNVVVVVLDTVRGLDTVPAEKTFIPTLASLTREGTEYRHAFTSAPWTLPAHAGLFTGTYSSKHNTHGKHHTLDSSLTTLPEIFSSEGYDTFGISNNTWISDEFGFDRGFDSFNHGWTSSELQCERSLLDIAVNDTDERPVLNGDDGAQKTTTEAIDWLSTRRSRQPFFLFLNYIDAHFEYTPPKQFVADRLPSGYDYNQALNILHDPRKYDVDEVTLTEEEFATLRTLYRAEITYLDANVRKLIDGIKAVGEWEDTILIVTSDHGENIGEHGFLGHQYNIYDTLLHVPLIITGGSFNETSNTDQLVQLPDLAPTLLDEVNIDAPAMREQFQGRSFHPSSTAIEREYIISEYIAPQPSIKTLEQRFTELPPDLYTFDRSLRAIRTFDYKLIRGSDGSRELYNINVNPAETKNIIQENPEIAEFLEDKLDRWLASFEQKLTQTSPSISSESRERLRDLGYL
ncbi:sulfatase [Haladaptatus halobius]|uniref:sulfatase n=1 Tax=Haladaptatus halobius TaxID=2884875 RepID=UPI001D0BC948|nr:sulfatase [Haladaptatus halobius]